MAYNKIIAITTRLDQSLNYVINPEKTLKKVMEYTGDEIKTEGTMFVKAFNCDKDTAYSDMINTQKLWKKAEHKNAVLAYHLIQSFPKNIVSAEQAYQHGKDFVERYLADKYEVVISTHLDRQHFHNHIIFNSVSFMDGKKYRNDFKDYFVDIRGMSDTVSKEHGLPVITPKGKGKHYAEWKAEQENRPTIRSVIRQEVDEIIKDSYNFQTFIEILRRRGYTVKYGERVKHIAVRPPHSVKFIRLKSLGENYTEENIKLRLEAQRKGIRQLDTVERKPPKRYRLVKGTFGILKPKKIRGFMALYLHYLYLLGKVKKRSAPKKVSFLMREELLKFERYQKQFRFLRTNNIATKSELVGQKQKIEEEINSLISKRKDLYTQKKAADTEQIQSEIDAVNARLRELRKDKKLCENIENDIPIITKKLHQTEKAQEKPHYVKEEQNHEHKR